MTRYFYLTEDKVFVALNTKNFLYDSLGDIQEVSQQVFDTYNRVGFLIDTIVDENTVEFVNMPYQKDDYDCDMVIDGSQPIEGFDNTFSLLSNPSDLYSCEFVLREGDFYSAELIDGEYHPIVVQEGLGLATDDYTFRAYTYHNLLDTDLKLEDNKFLLEIATFPNHCPIHIRIYKDMFQILRKEFYLFTDFI